MTKTMDQLLSRSAKMLDMASKVKDAQDSERPRCSLGLNNLPRSLVAEFKSLHKKMDDHYDNVAASLARFKNTNKPSEQRPASNFLLRSCQLKPPSLRLLKEITEKLEVAEILFLGPGFKAHAVLRGSKATRAESHAQSEA